MSNPSDRFVNGARRTDVLGPFEIYLDYRRDGPRGPERLFGPPTVQRLVIAPDHLRASRIQSNRQSRRNKLKSMVVDWSPTAHFRVTPR
mmetsp:Transcript_17904/g.49611  ORF Transcript_17904/g.49611 Transcript_17904/m.49611 type:complete len:89 (+) Transcript_17904:1531-1797(+)